MSDSIIPTFSNNKDRIVYLLGEYKIPISVTFLCGAIFLIAARPELPSVPQSWLNFLGPWMILTIPAYLFGKALVKWVRQRNWNTVFHINAVEDTREKWMVPPETWQNKTVEGDAPNLVNEKDAYEVRTFEWHEDTGDLVVEGTWLSEAADGKLVTDRSHMKAIHDHLMDAFNELCQLRGTWSDQSIEMQKQIINAGAEARERGLLQDKQSAKEVWEKYTDVPEVEQEVPTLEDTVEDQAAKQEELGEPVGPVEQGDGDLPGEAQPGETLAADGGDDL
jgi:predicted transcriptional regulator